jgi:hypothetical protein
MAAALAADAVNHRSQAHGHVRHRLPRDLVLGHLFRVPSRRDSPRDEGAERSLKLRPGNGRRSTPFH